MITRDNVRIMYIGEYYRGGKELQIIAHAHHQQYGTLRQFAPGRCCFVYFDAGVVETYEGEKLKYRGDVDLIAAVEALNPHLIIFEKTGRMEFPPNPTNLIFAYLVWKQNRVVFGQTHDVGPATAVQWEITFPMLQKIIQIDGFDAKAHVGHKARWYKTFPPHVDGFIGDPFCDRPIDICHTGRPHEWRIETLDYLKNNGIDIWHRDYQQYENYNIPDLPYEEIQAIHGQSKISLSDTIGKNWRGRNWEAAICGSMIMETEESTLHEWFVPEKEYVPYRDREDMIEKIRYYLAHDNERMEIAEAGQQKYKSSYTGKHFWEGVLEQAGL